MTGTRNILPDAKAWFNTRAPRDREAERIANLTERRSGDSPEQTALKQELQKIEEKRRPHIQDPFPHPGGTLRRDADRNAAMREEERRQEIIGKLEKLGREKSNFNDGNA